MLPRSIVILNRFYWPDVAATAQMLTDLAEDLAARGWAVTVITGTTTYDAIGTAGLADEQRNSVRIRRIRGTRFGRNRLVGRMTDYISYLFGATLQLLRVDKPDAIVAMSDPPFVLAPALLVAWLRGTKVVYWVQDLFPQIAAALGVVDANSFVYRCAKRIADSLNRRCDLVIALGPRMATALVEAGAPPSRTNYVHNWADGEAIKPIPNEANDFLREHDLFGRFVVLYSGNAGRAHTFDAVLFAAQSLLSDSRIVFVFIGGGNRIPAIRRAAAERGLHNIRFFDYVPRERLAHSLSAASVSLVTEDPSVVGLLVPSKTYGILASGRPIIFVGSAHSDVGLVVSDASCGVIIAPDDGPALAKTIRDLSNNSGLAAEWGARARQAAEQLYTRSVATDRWMEIVERGLFGRSANQTSST